MRNDYLGSCYQSIAYPTLITANVIPSTSLIKYDEITTTLTQYTTTNPNINVATTDSLVFPTLKDGIISPLGACPIMPITTILNTLPASYTHWSKDSSNPVILPITQY
jgi:hypothetical protein